jgi:hypothetical protein
MRLRMTCSSWTRSPWMRAGRPRAASALRSHFSVPRHAQAQSRRALPRLRLRCLSGCFLHERTNAAHDGAGPIGALRGTGKRLPDLHQIRRGSVQEVRAAVGLLRVTPSGWFTSWVIEAVSWPMVSTRLACASSLCISRYCRSRRVLSKAMVASAAKSPNREICLSVNGCDCFRPD